MTETPVSDATQPGAEPSEDADVLRRLSDLVSEEPAQDAPEDRQAEPATEPALIKIKVDGAEKEVKLDDLVARYQKSEAAEKRLEEASRLRREAEERAGTVNTERQQLSQALQHYVQMAQAFLPQPPTEALMDADPVEFQKQQYRYNQAIAKLQQAQTAQAYLSQQQTAQQQQQHAKSVEAETQRLLEKLPEWKDEKRAQKEEGLIREYLKSMGYEDAAQAMSGDHRRVLMAREAALYRQLLAKAKESPAKPSVRVERPGTGSSTDGRTSAMQRLSRSGRAEDAQAIFKAMLDSEGS